MLRIHARITKIDQAKRLVWGRATQEVPDNSDEIFDYASSKPYFEKWSNDFAKNTNGKSLGNIRGMHGNIAAGKAIEVHYLDDEKAIDICAKIVDDNEWQKVDEGVYTGFSIGGKYVKKWADGMLTRYTARPSEISLVDKPCVPTANFYEVIKMDGSTQQKEFKSKTAEEAVNELADLITKGTVTPFKLLELAKREMDPSDDDPADDPNDSDVDQGDDELVKPDDVSQDDWDAMSDDEKRALVDKAAKATKDDDGGGDAAMADNPEFAKLSAEDQNKLVEAEARKMAAVEFEKLEPAAKAGREADGDWQNYVPDALRACKLVKREFSQDQRDKAADDGDALPDGSFPIKTVADLKNAIQAYGRAKDKAKAKAHIIARAKALGAEDQLPDDWKGDGSSKADAPTKEGDDAALIKSMSDVRCFADVLQQIATLAYCSQYDATVEGDSSPVPAQLKDWLSTGVGIFGAMAAEESSELVSSLSARAGSAVIAMSESIAMGKRLEDPACGGDELKEAIAKFLGDELAKSDKPIADLRADALAKYGARHSADDSSRLQSIHDNSVGMGAKCDKGDMASDKNAQAEPGVTNPVKLDAGALLKLVTATKEIETLTKNVQDLTQAGVLLAKELKMIKDQPRPPKGVLRSIGKEGDVIKLTTTDDKSDKKDDVKKLAPEGTHDPESAFALIKGELGRVGLRKG